MHGSFRGFTSYLLLTQGFPHFYLITCPHSLFFPIMSPYCCLHLISCHLYCILPVRQLEVSFAVPVLNFLFYQQPTVTVSYIQSVRFCHIFSWETIRRQQRLETSSRSRIEVSNGDRRFHYFRSIQFSAT